MSEVYREFGAKGMEIKVAVITAPQLINCTEIYIYKN